MKCVLLSLLICVALSEESNVSRLTENDSESATPFSLLPFLDGSVTCATPGSFCSDDAMDCDFIFLCIPGQVNAIKSKCGFGQTCNNGKCSVTPSPLCEYTNRPFRCQTTGMFPDPSSCKDYNICCDSSSTPTTLTCERGYGYNPSTTFCDIELNNNQCDPNHREIPACFAIGQNGALKSNSVLYYICLPYGDGDDTLYPFIHKCPNGKIYIGDFICQ